MSPGPENLEMGTTLFGRARQRARAGIAGVKLNSRRRGIKPARDVREKNRGQPDLLPPID